MSDNRESRKQAGGDANTIAFGRRYTQSEQFQVVYANGMALIEETARYLDGEGRRSSRKLDQSAGLLYSTESMRLTTRLMQLASWLLIRRAVNDGEMSPQEAFTKKNRIKLRPSQLPPKNEVWDRLPDRAKELIEASHRLNNRILKLDRLLLAEMRGLAPVSNNPIGADLQRLQAAYRGPDAGLQESRK